MMDTLLCLIYLYANTFTPIYTCLKIQFKKISDNQTRVHFSVLVRMPPGAGYLKFPDIRVITRLCPSYYIYGLCDWFLGKCWWFRSQQLIWMQTGWNCHSQRMSWLAMQNFLRISEMCRKKTLVRFVHMYLIILGC